MTRILVMNKVRITKEIKPTKLVYLLNHKAAAEHSNTHKHKLKEIDHS